MLDIIILAAGKGTRMKSSLPKVLHPVGGIPMLEHVLNSSRQLNAEYLNIIIGHGAEKVQQQYQQSDIRFVQQTEQLGTGHAVQQAMEYIRAEAITLILYGDVPLIQPETLKKLIQTVSSESIGLLTVNLDNPTGYGRIVRGPNNEVLKIVEEKDASATEKLITEGNTGVLALMGKDLLEWLPKLNNNNAQGEYYLTDLIAIAKAHQKSIKTETVASEFEVLGVNNRVQQAQLERYYQTQQAEKLMHAGVTLIDPERFDCRGSVTVGEDVIIDVNCTFEGEVEIGNRVSIGPNCIITNSRIGNDSVIKANSLCEETIIGNNCEIGPFARARPGTVLSNNAKLGNFVETKKANIGEGSKINHLTYVGDAEIGAGVNVGAGTITCNYDGVNKFKTEIGDAAFIGSNSSLVAPIKIGKGATIAAGSTITSDVAEDSLSVARAKQRSIAGWKKPVKK